MTLINGEASYVHGSEDLIQLRPDLPTYSTQFLSKSQWLLQEDSPEIQQPWKQPTKDWAHKFLDFKTHHKATAIKTMWCLYEDRHRDKWNRTENSNINLYMYGHFYFWQEYQDKLIEIIAVLTNGAGTTRYSQAKEWSWTSTSRHIQKKKKKKPEKETQD